MASWYLNKVQQRYKWKDWITSMTGSVVSLKENNIPPMQWLLGRIIRKFPGNDNLINVIEVGTVKGTVRRPIHMMGPLLVESTADTTNQESDSTNACERKPPDQEKQRIIGKKAMPATIEENKSWFKWIDNPSANVLLPVASSNISTGLYFDPQGVARIISSHWNLVVYCEMQGYYREIALLKQEILTSRRLCNLFKVQNTAGVKDFNDQSRVENLQKDCHPRQRLLVSYPLYYRNVKGLRTKF